MAIKLSHPEEWPPATIAWVVGICTLYAIAWHLSCRQEDPREPPVVSPTIPIPFIGHLLGMALQGGRYVKRLGLRHRSQPIFTMRILNQRIYIVTSPPFAAAVQRASKALSFTPIIPEVTQPVLGLDDATMEIVRQNLDPGPGEEPGYLAEIQDLVHRSLGPGRYLDELTLDAVRELRGEVAAYAATATTAGKEEEEDLLLWVRHLVTAATARYLYGPENPIALEPALEGAFWDFDHGLVALLIGFRPDLTARRAYRGRERLAAALGDYLEAGRHEKKAGGAGGGGGGSWIIRRRVELALKHGWTLRMAARSELSFLFAGIVNTTTTAFWVLARLYADPALLATVRSEAQAAIEPADGAQQQQQQQQQQKNGKRKQKMKLRIPALRERCPTLAAVLSECLRLGSDNFSNRRVMEDTALAAAGSQFLLKKDAIVQIAGGVIHADESIWGGDVEAFNPGRFLPSSSTSSSDVHSSSSSSGSVNGGGSDGKGPGQGQGQGQQQQQRHPAAFRAFGGGKTLCPGRHFAQSEILAFVALVVLALDMRAATGAAAALVEVPPKKDTGLPVHILEPAKPVKVVVSRRRDVDDDDDGGVDIGDIEFTMD